MGTTTGAAPAAATNFDIIGSVSPRAREALMRGWDNARLELDRGLFTGMVATVEAVLAPEHQTRPTSVDEVEEAVFSVTEQFIDYVPDIDSRELALLEERLGAKEMRHLVHAMYILDQNVRLGIALQKLDLRLSGGSRGSDDAAPEARPGLVRAGWDWHHSVYALRGGLDIVTNELLRLRAGEYHHCDFCLSLRRLEGGTRVVSPALEGMLSGYQDSDMPRRLKTALRLADVYMSDPVQLDRAIRDDLMLDYSVEQIAEILMVVSACNHQKVRVALGTAMPARPQGLSEYVVHDDGSIEVGELLPRS